MGTAVLTIDLNAIRANWRALDAMTGVETAAVVKADAYGCGIDRVARALAAEGARTFCVAMAEEGAALRQALGPGPVINVFAGHMPGDAEMISDLSLVPMINSIEQLIRHAEALPGKPFGIQLDTGMNRLGMEPAEWAAVRDMVLRLHPTLIMSHLACADEPEHPMNAEQLHAFLEMTDDTGVPRSLAATGGILLGKAFHFDLCRPGVGLFGGLPFVDARPVVGLEAPVIQCRDIAAGETVGYGNTFTASRDTRIATISSGYADGLPRRAAPEFRVYVGETPCPVAGRISMDTVGIDITGLDSDPETVEILGLHQSVDTLAGYAGTIGYEMLTSLGARYSQRYIG